MKDYINGILEFEGHTVYNIDSMPTCITSVHGNYAQGFVIEYNSVKVPCYIVRIDDCFAHGDTLHKAFEDATGKAMSVRPIEERLKIVVERYPDLSVPIDNSELFTLHNILTGSCELGRLQFCKEHDIDMNGTTTMYDFIKMTMNEYGGENIKLLANKYNTTI